MNVKKDGSFSLKSFFIIYLIVKNYIISENLCLTDLFMCTFIIDLHFIVDKYTIINTYIGNSLSKYWFCIVIYYNG